MLVKSVIGILMVLLISCDRSQSPKYAFYYGHPRPATDTSVCRTDITKSITGAAYKEKVYQYFLLAGNDTTDFTCYISNSRINEFVYIDTYTPNNHKVTYREKINGLKKILPFASGDFNLKNVKSLRIGQLIETGDLAIDITRQYEARLGRRLPISDYNALSELLEESTLSIELNNLFSPYSIGITNIEVEKVAFITKEMFYKTSNPQTDFISAPDKIINCTPWITLRQN